MNPLGFYHGGALVLLALGLAFAFSDGYRDSSSIVATVVSTRTLTPVAAFSICALFEFAGALLIGSAVASTVSSKVLGQTFRLASRADVILISGAAIAAAFAWGLVSWWYAWPTSNSHALIGGLSGAGAAAWGVGSVQGRVILTIVAVLIASPMLGFVFSLGLTSFFRWLGGWLTNRTKPLAESLHVLSCLFVSCAHGSNDGQLVMGALVPILGTLPGSGVPFSLRLVVALALAAGVLLGGRRILKRLGMQFFRIQNPQGLSAEFTSASTVFLCSLAGFPASTTQVIAGSIMGAAVAKNARRARWSVAHEMAMSWALTFPAVAVIAYAAVATVHWWGAL